MSSVIVEDDDAILCAINAKLFQSEALSPVFFTRVLPELFFSLRVVDLLKA